MKKSLKNVMTSVIVIIIIISIPIGKIILDGYTKYKDIENNISIEETIIDIESKQNYTKIKDIDEDFLNAIVSVEDHRFYKHNGLDYIGIVRATINNINERQIVQGGSTITQQLVKNLFLDNDKKFSRKITEVFLVNKIENKYSKNQILELYVNIINYGNGYVGIKEASKGYLNKDVDELSYDNAAMLAGLPQSPESYNLNKYYEKALARQKIVMEAINRYGNKEYNEDYYLVPVDERCIL